MRMFIAIVAFVAAFTFGLAAEAAICGKHDRIVKHLKTRFKETRRAVALTSHSMPLLAELYVSEKGSWTVLVTNTSDTSCIVASGYSWQPVRGVPPFIGPNAF